MSVIVRKAKKEDIDSLVVLMDYLLGLEGDFPNESDKQRKGFRLVLESDIADVFVAELDEKIVGMCSLHMFISTVQGTYAGVIEDVVVDAEYEGMGIGGEMLAYVEDFAKSAGVTRLSLMVDKDNDKAISFYKKQDWAETKYIGFRKYI